MNTPKKLTIVRKTIAKPVDAKQPQQVQGGNNFKSTSICPYICE